MTVAQLSAARCSVALIFMLLGLQTSAWVAQIALAKERLAVGPAMFGLGLLAIAGGAMCSMPMTGALINRFGSARLTRVSGAVLFVVFLGPIFAPNFAAFVPAAILMGMSAGSLDVAMNAHGLAVETRLRIATMSLFHGAFSLGCVLGTGLAAGLIELVGTLWQPPVTALLLLAIHLTASAYLLPSGTDRGGQSAAFGWPTRATIGLGTLALLGLLIEGAVLDWGAIYLRAVFAVDARFAALVFGSFQGGMAIARFTGDWLRLKFGAVRLVTVSALMTAAGIAAGLAAPSLWLAGAAFVFAGLGIGNVVPVLFAGGGRLDPEAPGRGIAAITTLGYSGFLLGPALIGFTAELTGLRLALGLTVLAAIVISMFARMVDAADRF